MNIGMQGMVGRAKKAVASVVQKPVGALASWSAEDPRNITNTLFGGQYSTLVDTTGNGHDASSVSAFSQLNKHTARAAWGSVLGIDRLRMATPILGVVGDSATVIFWTDDISNISPNYVHEFYTDEPSSVWGLLVSAAGQVNLTLDNYVIGGGSATAVIGSGTQLVIARVNPAPDYTVSLDIISPNVVGLQNLGTQPRSYLRPPNPHQGASGSHVGGLSAHALLGWIPSDTLWIREMTVYDKPLTDQQILQYYNATKGNYGL